MRLLSLSFTRDGVPPAIFCSGAKEQTMADLKKKMHQADSHAKAVDPHAPQASRAEITVKELKNLSKAPSLF